MKENLIKSAYDYYDEVSGRGERYLTLEADGLAWEADHHGISREDYVLLMFKDELIHLLRKGELPREKVETILDNVIAVESESLEVQSLEDFANYIDPIKKRPNSPIDWGWKAPGRCDHRQQIIPGDWPGLLTASAALSYSKMSNNELDSQPQPDFGLYADSSWQRISVSRNEFINWPDMDVPVDFKVAVNQMKDAKLRLEAGEHVDVGCVGGHGRTGTILAAIKILDNYQHSADEAVNWVRDKYCSQAVETREQIEFLRYIKKGVS